MTKTNALLLMTLGAGMVLGTFMPAGAQSDATPSASAPAGFGALDVDGDGGLSPEEFAARKSAHSMRMLQMADVDGDGRVTRDELLTHATARVDDLMARADADADGALSPGEIDAARPRWRNGRRGHDMGGSGHRGLRHGPDHADSARGGPRGRRAGAATFDRLDTDGDGLLNPAEWAAMDRGAPAR